ncbi:hypothetical protein [Nostoc piscinale]|uniref:hypothetical protein n=1 Tax=Nostoc piscinale TaxID=224012 RepID=UPI00130E1D4C|nr:hypothetical protein [Nostoc piscinale]
MSYARFSIKIIHFWKISSRPSSGATNLYTLSRLPLGPNRPTYATAADQPY